MSRVPYKICRDFHKRVPGRNAWEPKDIAVSRHPPEHNFPPPATGLFIGSRICLGSCSVGSRGFWVFHQRTLHLIVPRGRSNWEGVKRAERCYVRSTTLLPGVGSGDSASLFNTVQRVPALAARRRGSLAIPGRRKKSRTTRSMPDAGSGKAAREYAIDSDTLWPGNATRVAACAT